MPWIDVLLLAAVAGQGVSGYFLGAKCWLRVGAATLILLLALPLAKPLGMEIDKALPGLADLGVDSLLIPVGDTSLGGLKVLGPWQEVLGVPASTAPEHLSAYIAQVKELVQSVFGYILAAMALAGSLLALGGNQAKPSLLGAALGFSFGLVLVLTILILLPPVSLTDPGQWIGDSLGESVLSKLFLPLLVKGANLIARFFI